MGAGYLKTFLKKKKGCRVIPQYIDKPKDEIQRLFPNMHYWSITEYFRFLDLGEKLDNLLEEEEEPQETEEDIFSPSFIGTVIHEGRLIVFFLNEKEKVKDSFYIHIKRDLYSSLSEASLEIISTVIYSLEVRGFTEKDLYIHSFGK
ncbi:MAG: hypothetical protein LIP05_16315 [Tannerellaceae bacterium]|nr:hypothetical protein [Tannerellaceae bacterium]